MIVDSKILGAGKNAYFGPSFPTQEFTIEIGPGDEDGIRTVRVTADPCRGSRSAGRATQNNQPGGLDLYPALPDAIHTDS